MATDVRTRMDVHDVERTSVRVEDVMAVKTRVGWGAIFAGAVMALAAYLVLTLLGSAIGFSVSTNVTSESLGTGAAIWAIAVTGIALFLGGWVTSQCLVGENKMEAIVHGIITWGVVLALILWLVSVGLRAGFSAMWGVASFSNAAAQNTNQGDWETAAQRAGVSSETINEWKQKATNAPANVRQQVENPANRQAAADYATQTTWYTLLGTLLSMAAAVVGALVGAGPTLRLLGTGNLAGRTPYVQTPHLGRS